MSHNIGAGDIHKEGDGAICIMTGDDTYKGMWCDTCTAYIINHMYNN